MSTEADEDRPSIHLCAESHELLEGDEHPRKAELLQPFPRPKTKCPAALSASGTGSVFRALAPQITKRLELSQIRSHGSTQHEHARLSQQSVSISRCRPGAQ